MQEAQKKAALPAVELEPYAQENVDFDTFCKSDFRAVKVKNCEAVKKSDKLLKFTLDDGSGTDRHHPLRHPPVLRAGAAHRQDRRRHPEPAAPEDDGHRASCGMLISAVHKEQGEEKLNLMHDRRLRPRRRQAVLTK